MGVKGAKKAVGFFKTGVKNLVKGTTQTDKGAEQKAERIAEKYAIQRKYGTGDVRKIRGRASKGEIQKYETALRLESKYGREENVQEKVKQVNKERIKMEKEKAKLNKELGGDLSTSNLKNLTSGAKEQKTKDEAVEAAIREQTDVLKQSLGGQSKTGKNTTSKVMGAQLTF